MDDLFQSGGIAENSMRGVGGAGVPGEGVRGTGEQIYSTLLAGARAGVPGKGAGGTGVQIYSIISIARAGRSADISIVGSVKINSVDGISGTGIGTQGIGMTRCEPDAIFLIRAP